MLAGPAQTSKDESAITDIETRILDLYRRVGISAAEWGERVPLIAEAGFRILCGPPNIGTPMVVSLNPGKGNEGDDLWPKRWPKRLSYLRGLSKFSNKLAQVFDSAEIKLESVNAGYALAFRSDSMKEWRKNVPLGVRKSAQQVSLDVLKKLISALKPSFIYVSGFDTFKLMRCSCERIEHGRHINGVEFELLRYGCFSEVPFIASPHLSGYRLSRENMDQISQGLLRMSINPGVFAMTATSGTAASETTTSETSGPELSYPRFEKHFTEFIGVAANGHLWVEGRDCVDANMRFRGTRIAEAERHPRCEGVAGELEAFEDRDPEQFAQEHIEGDRDGREHDQRTTCPGKLA